MAEAKHLSKRIASPATTTSTTTDGGTSLTVTAAELSAAGFEDNDEVLLLVHVDGTHSAVLGEYVWRPRYDGVGLPTATPQLHAWNGNYRAQQWMSRVDLGTLADFTVTFWGDRAGTTTLAFTEVEIIDMAAFGTENTDWFWSDVVTSTYANNSGGYNTSATVTWTPDDVEDWVVLSWNGQNSTTGGDSYGHAFKWDADAEDFVTLAEDNTVTEQRSWLRIRELSGVSAASHTISARYRFDRLGTFGTAVQRARMLVFRKDVWPDLFFDGNDSVNIPTATSVELATITDTPSTSQDAIFIGWMSMTTDGGDDNAFLWARENGSTVVPPDQSVTANQRSRDATDLLPVGVIGAVALDGSALDLDMFGSHSDDSTLQATTARFLVWGMTTTASPPDPPDPTTPIRVMRSPRYGITRSATR